MTVESICVLAVLLAANAFNGLLVAVASRSVTLVRSNKSLNFALIGSCALSASLAVATAITDFLNTGFPLTLHSTEACVVMFSATRVIGAYASYKRIGRVFKGTCKGHKSAGLRRFGLGLVIAMELLSAALVSVFLYPWLRPFAFGARISLPTYVALLTLSDVVSIVISSQFLNNQLLQIVRAMDESMQLQNRKRLSMSHARHDLSSQMTSSLVDMLAGVSPLSSPPTADGQLGSGPRLKQRVDDKSPMSALSSHSQQPSAELHLDSAAIGPLSETPKPKSAFDCEETSSFPMPAAESGTVAANSPLSFGSRPPTKPKRATRTRSQPQLIHARSQPQMTRTRSHPRVSVLFRDNVVPPVFSSPKIAVDYIYLVAKNGILTISGLVISVFLRIGLVVAGVWPQPFIHGPSERRRQVVVGWLLFVALISAELTLILGALILSLSHFDAVYKKWFASCRKCVEEPFLAGIDPKLEIGKGLKAETCDGLVTAAEAKAVSQLKKEIEISISAKRSALRLPIALERSESVSVTLSTPTGGQITPISEIGITSFPQTFAAEDYCGSPVGDQLSVIVESNEQPVESHFV